MNSRLSISKQTLLFSLITVFFVVPYLILNGTNIVTHTYAWATHRFFSGQSPYVDPKGAGDWFKYSLFFTILYFPYADLGRSLQAALWGVTNILIYWWGVSCWFRWSKKDSKWLWLAFLFCSMEADGSYRYQQVNAALVGGSLIGMALYRDKKYFSSGFVLATVANIKILPIVFLCGLAIPVKPKYLMGALTALLFTFLTPLIFIHWDTNIAFNIEWGSLLWKDICSPGLLDIATILGRYGYPNAREWVSYPIFIVSLISMMVMRFTFTDDDWENWIALALLTLLLVSPRTESPTFVLAGPAYLFSMSAILKSPSKNRWFYLALWLAGCFFVTLCMNDIWPRKIWNASSLRYANKTFGIFLLWLLSMLLMLPQVIEKLKRATPLVPQPA